MSIFGLEFSFMDSYLLSHFGAHVESIIEIRKEGVTMLIQQVFFALQQPSNAAICHGYQLCFTICHGYQLCFNGLEFLILYMVLCEKNM
ncbi:hypothetical protein L1887_28338 [Cichorium endivia]|nr:hypothetical protein L1887_28338 [Cichorium endivia]